MRKSNEFNNVLDVCLEKLLVKGETLEQCLLAHPDYAEELKPLLETAMSVRQLSTIQPRSEVKDRARYQFYSVLEGVEAKKQHRFFWKVRPQWTAVIAIVLVLLLGGTGTVAAAGNSLPAEPLYPVKLASEQVRLVFAHSELDKMEVYAQLADRRVMEIVVLVHQNKPEQIKQTTQRFDVYMMRIVELSSPQDMLSAAPMAPSIAQAPGVNETTVLSGEPTPAPAVVQPPMAGRAPFASDRGMGGMVKTMGDGRRGELRMEMGRYAADHPERLRALLSTAPPSARAALLEAITASENGYQKALDSLNQP